MFDELVREPLTVNGVNRTITVPHLGITLRVLFGAALSSWPNPQPGERRDYSVVHRGACVATLHVKQHDVFEFTATHTTTQI